MPEKFLLFFFILLMGKTGTCQTVQTATGDNAQKQVSEARLAYVQFAGQEAPLYYGRDYYPNMFLAKGTPFFISDVFDTGWVAYKGWLYRNVPLRYDLQRNQLIAANSGGANIILDMSRVDSFAFHGHTFGKLQKNIATNLLTTGFYDLLYLGKVKLICLRSRGVTSSISGRKMLRTFVNEDKYYVFKDGLYYLVTNKREVYRVLQDHRKEIKRKVRSERLRWNKAQFENSLLKTIEFYDHLT